MCSGILALAYSPAGRGRVGARVMSSATCAVGAAFGQEMVQESESENYDSFGGF